MPALNRRHLESTRARIQAAKLIDRLDAAAMGEIDLTPQQVRAIEILLKKTLPDLSATELSGADGGPLQANVNVQFISPSQHDPAADASGAVPGQASVPV